MQALRMIRQLRFQLQVEMLALPECEELKATERALSIYENIIVQRGLEDRELGPKVHDAFMHLLTTARAAFPSDEAPRLLPAKSRPAVASQKPARSTIAPKARAAAEPTRFWASVR